MTISPVTQERITPSDSSHEEKLNNLLSRLSLVKRGFDGNYIARCPAHDDRSPSLTVKQGDRWILVHCFAGCDPTSVIHAVDLEWKDLALKGKDEPVRRRPVQQREMELTIWACSEQLHKQEPELLERLRYERGWAGQALKLLGVGWDRSRLTLPVRDKDGKVHDVLRYDPFCTTGPKVLPARGKSRLPFPAPESIETPYLFLVEGEGTAISMLSVGLRAVGLPGSMRLSVNTGRPGSWRGSGWHKTWARRFEKFRHVILLPDLDGPGRALMGAARYDLEKAGVRCTIIDLGPKTFDGSDVADMLLSKAYDGPSRRVAKNVLREIVADKAEVLIAA